MLYCTLQNSTVLYCTLLYSTKLYCTILYYTVLYCITLYSTKLYCTLLYTTVLYYNLQEGNCGEAELSCPNTDGGAHTGGHCVWQQVILTVPNYSCFCSTQVYNILHTIIKQIGFLVNIMEPNQIKSFHFVTLRIQWKAKQNEFTCFLCFFFAILEMLP